MKRPGSNTDIRNRRQPSPPEGVAYKLYTAMDPSLSIARALYVSTLSMLSFKYWQSPCSPPISAGVRRSSNAGAVPRPPSMSSESCCVLNCARKEDLAAQHQCGSHSKQDGPRRKDTQYLSRIDANASVDQPKIGPYAARSRLAIVRKMA